MDSAGLMSSSSRRMMPFLAILRYELRSLWSSWLVRIWFVVATLLSLLILAGGWGNDHQQKALLIASFFLPFLILPWSLIAMLLGISPVTGSRLDALADGILSRPITRYEYLLASWSARVCVVLAVFFATTLPWIVIVLFAKRWAAEETVTTYGLISSLGLVSLVLVFLVSLGFLAGTLLRRPLVAAMLLVLPWLSVNVVLNAFDLEEFSTIKLGSVVPKQLGKPWRTVVEEEQEQGVSDEDLEAAREAAQFLSVLMGGHSQPVQPAPEEPGGFYARSEQEDFSLRRVVLAYSVPTLAAVALAMLCFCWRDL